MMNSGLNIVKTVSTTARISVDCGNNMYKSNLPLDGQVRIKSDKSIPYEVMCNLYGIVNDLND